MGGTTLHAGISGPMIRNSASVTFLKICYYGRQWDLIWCNDTCKEHCIWCVCECLNVRSTSNSS